jgi:hypothetical protein
VGRNYHRLLYSVRVNADTGHIELPIGVQDQGSPAANATAVLTRTVAFAEELEAEARLRLAAVTHR